MRSKVASTLSYGRSTLPECYMQHQVILIISQSRELLTYLLSLKTYIGILNLRHAIKTNKQNNYNINYLLFKLMYLTHCRYPSFLVCLAVQFLLLLEQRMIPCPLLSQLLSDCMVPLAKSLTFKQQQQNPN